MSNNKKVEKLRAQIMEVEEMLKYEQEPLKRVELLERQIGLRESYTPLLLKKRPFLLTMGIIFAIFYGISLAICLPPYVLRGKKRDINEDILRKLKVELEQLKREIDKQVKKGLLAQ